MLVASRHDIFCRVILHPKFVSIVHAATMVNTWTELIKMNLMFMSENPKPKLEIGIIVINPIDK